MSIPLNDVELLRTQAYIGGSWVDADDGATLAVTNPASGAVIAEVAKCGQAETRRAIEAARAAQVEWRQKTAKERAALLRQWFNLMMASQEDLAQILTAEQGKPLAEARGESPTARTTSSGLPKRPSASTATPSRSRPTTSAWWSSSSRWA